MLPRSLCLRDFYKQPKSFIYHKNLTTPFSSADVCTCIHDFFCFFKACLLKFKFLFTNQLFKVYKYYNYLQIPHIMKTWKIVLFVLYLFSVCIRHKFNLVVLTDIRNLKSKPVSDCYLTVEFLFNKLITNWYI